jgi:hypothetical protein
MILSFVICNLEGYSLRYRSLLSTGLLLGREQGLHRIDHNLNAPTANTLKAEMGRRMWSHLIATDWLAVARYGSPGASVLPVNLRHMSVNKPQHLNDTDLLVDGPWPSQSASESTDMSYFLQRLRLAELSRKIVDHTNANSQQQPAHHTNLLAIDVQFEQMINDIPIFLQMRSYQTITDCSGISSLFIQAYMLNSLMHTQRCKLHLTYLTSGGPSNPVCTSSCTACLASARELVRAETQLLESHHPFARAPLRPLAILYSAFVASIVLLMVACLNRLGELQEEIMRGDLGEALAIVRGCEELFACGGEVV